MPVQLPRAAVPFSPTSAVLSLPGEQSADVQSESALAQAGDRSAQLTIGFQGIQGEVRDVGMMKMGDVGEVKILWMVLERSGCMQSDSHFRVFVLLE